MSESAERFRKVAADFTATIDAVPADAWDNPSPCDGWVTRDVVGHLVEWLPGPGFLLGAFDVETGPIPSVKDDPAGAWAAVRDAVQGALDDPVVSAKEADCGPPGVMSLQGAIDMTCTPDVLIHTWDLATAAGISVTLNADEVASSLAAAESLSPEIRDAMAASGHFGPAVEAPDGADAQTRLLAFYGRRA